MSHQVFPPSDLDLNAALGTTTMEWGVAPSRRLHLEVALVTGTWATAVVELKRSISGNDWFSFDPAITITAEGLELDIDIGEVNYVTAELTTAEGVASEAVFVARAEAIGSTSEAGFVFGAPVPVQGVTDGATPVTIVPAPVAGTRAAIEVGDLAVLNEDTVAQTIILTLNSVVTERLVMPPGSKFVNDDRMVIEEAEDLTLELPGAVTTNELNWHANYWPVAD